MRETEGLVKATETSGSLGAARIAKQPITWSMTAKADPQKVSEFEFVLLAIAGHDLRQPLQVVQSAHDLLGHGVRTESEQRLLRSGQSAIDRLRDHLDQLLAALRLREHTEGVKLVPVRVGSLFRQACHENEIAALRKGVTVRIVQTTATIHSNALLLSTVLRNLVSNAIKYTQPGGRILLGCRHVGQSIRIDVYDTGVGIAGDRMPRIFEAFTRLDPARRPGRRPLHRASGRRHTRASCRYHLSAVTRVEIFDLRKKSRENSGATASSWAVLGNNIWSTAMKFVFVNDRALRAPSRCAYCSTSIGISYLRDLSSKRLYCDYKCHVRAAVPFAGAGIDGLSMLGLQWAGDFQRALLGSSDNS